MLIRSALLSPGSHDKKPVDEDDDVASLDIERAADNSPSISPDEAAALQFRAARLAACSLARNCGAPCCNEDRNKNMLPILEASGPMKRLRGPVPAVLYYYVGVAASQLQISAFSHHHHHQPQITQRDQVPFG